MSLSSSAIGGLKLSSNISDRQMLGRCYNFSIFTIIFSSFCAANILLISPFYFTVLLLGFQQWKNCCFPPSTPTRQSDVFTHNIVAMGLIEILASFLYSLGAYTSVFEVAELGISILYVCWFMKLFFHTVTCIECYLAVVHPVKYLGLKNESWIRRIIIGCIWLLFLFWAITAHFMTDLQNVLIFVYHLALFFTVMFYCCVSVLWSLKRPGPGEARYDRKHFNQTKRKAFYTILIIMSTVLFTLVWVMLSNILYTSPLLHLTDKCLMIVFVPWVTLPCNLVLPILYLQREGKLPQCT